MPTSRSYGDACATARALDVVGERWALLVVRELLFGPQRFSDVRRALPGASSNLVTDRLRELEGHGVVARRKLPPPAGSTVYELTEWGRELEPIVLALGAWGARVPLPRPATLGATSVLLFLRGSARPRGTACYRVELDSRVWTVRTKPGLLTVEPGEPATPDAAIRTDPPTLNALLGKPAELDAAITGGRMTIEGDRKAVRRLLREHEG
ncbi:winged helix-turn-helix transcriptional regulator [Amycolatopsis sp. NPDC051128]|uniref:winged helix-turn-helix transcriptional regulator n=1 Tax=Amycolatopsis sp. NPDC051128 TaxID=3155412 RepID=UPI0034291238